MPERKPHKQDYQTVNRNRENCLPERHSTPLPLRYFLFVRINSSLKPEKELKNEENPHYS